MVVSYVSSHRVAPISTLRTQPTLVAELTFYSFSLIHDKRLVRIVQQLNALSCFGQCEEAQDLLATE